MPKDEQSSAPKSFQELLENRIYSEALDAMMPKVFTNIDP
jgi:hypothetical protein